MEFGVIEEFIQFTLTDFLEGNKLNFKKKMDIVK